MATHPSILAWEILWTDEPGRLQSMGSQRVRHDTLVFILTLTLYYIYSFIFSQIMIYHRILSIVPCAM